MEYNPNNVQSQSCPPPLDQNCPPEIPNYNGVNTSNSPIQRQIGFGEAVKKGFANYCNFKGRASRSEFWWWQLFRFLIMLIPAGIMYAGIFSVIFGTVSECANVVEDCLYDYDVPIYDDDYDYPYEDDFITSYERYESARVDDRLDNPFKILFGSTMGMVGYALVLFIGLVLFLPSLGLIWRRLHDTGHSGALCLLMLIPFFNFIWGIVLLVWFCTESRPGENSYGSMPGCD